eukprot:15354580-Ditylum_brightwellii.AAC.1
MEDICKETVVVGVLYLQLHSLERTKPRVVITTAYMDVLVVEAMIPTLTPMLTKDGMMEIHVG